MEGRRRLTLLDQMSASSNGRALAGLSLNDVLLTEPVTKHSPPPPPPALPESIAGRTLLDIIRDEEPKSYRALIGKKDKKAWKSFKDRLRLKRAGSAWATSVRVPTSDIPIRNNANYASNHHHYNNNIRSHNSRRNSVRYVTPESNLEMSDDGGNAASGMRQISRRSSTRFGPNASIPTDEAEADSPSHNARAPMFTRRASVRFTADEVATDSPRRRLSVALEEERSLSAREAVAAQQAAEAAAAASAAAEEAVEGTENDGSSGAAAAGTTEAEPVRMSLMDLLGETDRQMGLESRYTMDDDEDEEYEEEEEEAVAAVQGNVEYNCCVCMVRHKGAAFIPCGHTFCRMCSRELWVQRGNCPLCNNFILEILDIF